MSSNRLFKSGMVIAVFTLISKATGLVRDIVMTTTFGASAMVDAFFVALRIPNFFRRTLGEGVFSNAFIPVYAKEVENTGNGNATGTGAGNGDAVISQVALVLASVLFVICIVFMVFAPAVIAVFAPGFLEHPLQAHAATVMLRFTMPYLFFISLTAMAMGVLNTHHHFGYGAFAPTLFNLCIIVAVLFGQDWFSMPLYSAALAVSVSGVLQWLLLKAAMLKNGITHSFLPRMQGSFGYAKRVGKIMLPSIVSSSAFQINAVVDTIIASVLVTGSITWLNYGDRLMEVPLGIFAIAIGSVVLPAFARSHAAGNRMEYYQILAWGVRVVLFLSLPSLVGLCLLADPIIRTLFFYGAFTATDVTMTAYALIAYTIGLPALMLIKIYAAAWFSMENSAKPMKAGLLSLLIHLVFSLGVLGVWFQFDSAPPWLHTFLALATSSAAIMNCYLLRKWLKQHDSEYFLHNNNGDGWNSDGWDIVPKLMIATSIMAAVLLALLQVITIVDGSVLLRITKLSMLIASGIATFFISVHLLGINVRSVIIRWQ